MLVAVLIGTITGYDDTTGAHPFEGITTSGKRAEWGTCACSEEWEFGTVFVIEEVGVFTCWDRGGLIQQRGQIDIWYPTYQLAKEHGVWTRWAEVYKEVVIPRGLREE